MNRDRNWLYWLSLSMLCALASASLTAEASRVRHVQVKGDEIAVVKTAVGVATLIQLPDKPSSVVVGDQGAFKIEYLDQALAIKPLHGGARSNLYVYTDWRRFSVQLVTGAASSADYVIYLDSVKVRPKATRASDIGPKQGVHWRPYVRTTAGGGVNWRVTELGKDQTADPGSESRWIRFELSSSVATAVEPEGFWLTQQGRVRPIHRLVLSSNRIEAGGKIHGILQVRRVDLLTGRPLLLELRRKGKGSLTLKIPEESKWM